MSSLRQSHTFLAICALVVAVFVIVYQVKSQVLGQPDLGDYSALSGVWRLEREALRADATRDPFRLASLRQVTIAPRQEQSPEVGVQFIWQDESTWDVLARTDLLDDYLTLTSTDDHQQVVHLTITKQKSDVVIDDGLNAYRLSKDQP